MSFSFLAGHVIDRLRELPDGSVHCCVTSPPYWGLRDYKIPPVHWDAIDYAPMPGLPPVHVDAMDCCLGLEKTPEAFVGHIVQVFREVKRVLREDGVLFLNLGDSYTSGGRKTRDPGQSKIHPALENWDKGRPDDPAGLKPKNLIGIPWRVAFALQADGWVLRQDIIWNKVNPLPESVQDRCTKSHEYIFLFCKAKWAGPKQRQFDRISEQDARWLALFLDTEGNICAKRAVASNGVDHFGTQICFASTSATLVNTAHAIIGAGSVTQRPGKNAPVWYLQLANRQAADLLIRLYPYLIVKPRQAKLAVHLQNILATSRIERLTESGKLRGRCRSEKHTEQLIRIWSTMKALNHFGQPDISWVPEPKMEVGGWIGCNRYFYDSEAVKEASGDPIGSANRYRSSFTGTNGAVVCPGDSVGQRTRPDGIRKFDGSRNKRSVWTIPSAPFKGAHFACVDDETECLTQHGWAKYPQISEGTLIAAYNLQRQELRWEPVNALAIYDYDGKLCVLGGRDLGFKVTPNHRCLVRTRSGNWSVRRADRLVGGLSVPTCAAWSAGTFGSSDDPGPDMAALLGWIIGEAHFTKYGIVIHQSVAVNPHKAARIESLLRSCNVKYSCGVQKRTWRGRDSSMGRFGVSWQDAERLRSFIPGKRPTWRMLCWSRQSLEALWDALVDGDGHRRKDGRVSFIQKDRFTAEFFQALSIRIGKRAILSQRNPTRRGQMFCVYTAKRQGHSLRGTGGNGAILSLEDFKGKVWCPSVESSFWLARRNGRILITGNTFPPKLVEPCILAGTSARGCCSKCGAPWLRVVERKSMVIDRSIRTHENGRTRSSGTMVEPPESKTIGWKPTCSCNAETIPCTVLDPFLGSGTTAQVSLEHGRNAIGIDISEEYSKLIDARTNVTPGLQLA